MNCCENQMMTKQDLMKKRQKIERFRHSSSLSASHAEQYDVERLASSWQRSTSAECTRNRAAAPLVHLKETYTSATMAHALQHCAQDLKHIAEQSSMVLAVGDIGSTIIKRIQFRKCKVQRKICHFIEGGQWREELVGTNALALSLKPSNLAVCFPMNIICLPFMIGFVMPRRTDPYSKQVLGVIDLRPPGRTPSIWACWRQSAVPQLSSRACWNIKSSNCLYGLFLCRRSCLMERSWC